MLRFRRASTPSLSFSISDESGFIADRTEAAAVRRMSMCDFDTPLLMLPLKLPSPKARPTKLSKVSFEANETAQDVETRASSKASTLSEERIVVQDEQTALTLCLQERQQAKQLLISAISQGDPSELAGAIAHARSKGVDNNMLAKAEATHKQLKASKLRKQLQNCGSSKISLNSSFPETLQAWSLPKQREVTPISPEAQARLTGMMEAQSFISESFEAWAVPRKSLHSRMQRRTRSSRSMTSIRVP